MPATPVVVVVADPVIELPSASVHPRLTPKVVETTQPSNHVSLVEDAQNCAEAVEMARYHQKREVQLPEKVRDLISRCRKDAMATFEVYRVFILTHTAGMIHHLRNRARLISEPAPASAQFITRIYICDCCNWVCELREYCRQSSSPSSLSLSSPSDNSLLPEEMMSLVCPVITISQQKRKLSNHHVASLFDTHLKGCPGAMAASCGREPGRLLTARVPLVHSGAITDCDCETVNAIVSDLLGRARWDDLSRERVNALALELEILQLSACHIMCHTSKFLAMTPEQRSCIHHLSLWGDRRDSKVQDALVEWASNDTRPRVVPVTKQVPKKTTRCHWCNEMMSAPNDPESYCTHGSEIEERATCLGPRLLSMAGFARVVGPDSDGQLQDILRRDTLLEDEPTDASFVARLIQASQRTQLHLDLSSNRCGPLVCRQLTQAIPSERHRRPRGLVGLHLSGNPIGNGGLRALVKLLVRVPGVELTSFSIGGGSGNNHGIMDAPLVAELLYQLGKRHCLQELDISGLLPFTTPRTTPFLDIDLDLDKQARLDEVACLLDGAQANEQAFLDIEQARLDDERTRLNEAQALLNDDQARLDEQARLDKVGERLNKEQAVLDQQQVHLDKQARLTAREMRRKVRRQAKQAFRRRVKEDPFLALQVCIASSPSLTSLRLQNVGLHDVHLAQLASSMTFPAERQWDLLDVSHNELRLSVAPEAHSATTAARPIVDGPPLSPDVLHDTLRRVCCCASLLLVGNPLSKASLTGSPEPTAENHAFAALARAVADACDHPELPDPSAQLAEIVVSKPKDSVASEAAHLLQQRMHNALSATYRLFRVVKNPSSQNEEVRILPFVTNHPQKHSMPARFWIAPDITSYQPAVALRQLLAPCVPIATRDETAMLEMGEEEKERERRKAEERKNYKAQTQFQIHVMRRGLNAETVASEALKKLFDAPASACESVRWSDLAHA